MEDWRFYRKKQKIAKKWAMILNNLSHPDTTSLRVQSSASIRMYCEQVKIATQIASYVAARQFAIVLHFNVSSTFKLDMTRHLITMKINLYNNYLSFICVTLS